MLACAVLLASYHALISKYSGGSSDPAQRRIIQGHPSLRFESDHDPSVHMAWQVEMIGLDKSVIRLITMCSYKKGVGLIEGTRSVCLSEFEEDESVRLLPKCAHAFHIPYIDTWLKSHSSCPLRRSEIVFMGTFPNRMALLQEREVPRPPPPLISGSTAEVHVANHSKKEDSATVIDNPTTKFPSRVRSDLGSTRDSIIEINEDRTQQIRRTKSMDHSYQVPLSSLELQRENQNVSPQGSHPDCGGSSTHQTALMNMERSLSSDRLLISRRGIPSCGTIPGR